MTEVHVALLGEGTPVWRPVQTRHVHGAVFEILGSVPDGEAWEFQPGQFVECEEQVFSSGSLGLVARRPTAA